MDWLFFLFLIGILAITILYSYWYGITPTPTSAIVKQHLIQMLPNKENGQIIDLGSGWGNLVFTLAKHYPHCQITGYEISPFPYFVSKIISVFSPFSNLSIKREDFFDVSLKEVSIVVCYLYPDAMLKLKAKFEKELRLGTLIISHTFAIPGWVPICMEYASDLYRTPIYIYEMGQNPPKEYNYLD